MIGELQTLSAGARRQRQTRVHRAARRPAPARPPAAIEARVGKPVPYTGSFARDTGNLLEALQSVPLGVPHGGALSSPFGDRANPFSGRGSESHGGLDFKGAHGEPVRATHWPRGLGRQGGYGNLVEVAHAKATTRCMRTCRASKSPRASNWRPAMRSACSAPPAARPAHTCGHEVQRRGERLDPEHFLAQSDTGASASR